MAFDRDSQLWWWAMNGNLIHSHTKPAVTRIKIRWKKKKFVASSVSIKAINQEPGKY